MYGFWKRFVARYRQLGGVLRVGCRVERIESNADGTYRVDTRRGVFPARQVVCAVPAQLAGRLGPPAVGEALRPYLRRDAGSLGGAVVVFLGVPEKEVEGQPFTHHQLLQSYDQPQGNGNNMFVSVSTPGDVESAPPGCRAVMISTHCDLAEWQGLEEAEYQQKKEAIGSRLVEYARRVYPELSQRPVVHEIATPRTYERFTSRPGGAVGGIRQTLANTNQNALPHDLGIPGFFLVGDSTWPGLGTVACVLGSRIVAEMVLARARLGRSTRPVRQGPLPNREVCHVGSGCLQ
jgi:phytoene dehydrogenase-like protein